MPNPQEEFKQLSQETIHESGDRKGYISASLASQTLLLAIKRENRYIKRSSL